MQPQLHKQTYVSEIFIYHACDSLQETKQYTVVMTCQSILVTFGNTWSLHFNQSLNLCLSF